MTYYVFYEELEEKKWKCLNIKDKKMEMQMIDFISTYCIHVLKYRIAPYKYVYHYLLI
jgi:hypothetical protein